MIQERDRPSDDFIFRLAAEPTTAGQRTNDPMRMTHAELQDYCAKIVEWLTCSRAAREAEAIERAAERERWMKGVAFLVSLVVVMGFVLLFR